MPGYWKRRRGSGGSTSITTRPSRIPGSTPHEELGATELLLTGAATNWCVRAAAYGALDRGNDVTLVSDAHTTETMEPEDGTRIEAATPIADLNIALTWLDYPGRKNRTVRVGELEF